MQYKHKPIFILAFARWEGQTRLPLFIAWDDVFEDCKLITLSLCMWKLQIIESLFLSFLFLSFSFTIQNLNVLGYLKVWHPRCVRSITQTCSVYISIYTCSHETQQLLLLVAIYNIQLHVSALYVGHHQVVNCSQLM
jgi:hypothetical protein